MQIIELVETSSEKLLQKGCQMSVTPRPIFKAGAADSLLRAIFFVGQFSPCLWLG